jgi:hypothetical protein
VKAIPAPMAGRPVWGCPTGRWRRTPLDPWWGHRRPTER